MVAVRLPFMRDRPTPEPARSRSSRSRAHEHTAIVRERLAGVVERITFQSPQTGWTVLKVAPFDAPHTRVTVTLHQVAVFAGATMEFHGNWVVHPRHGEQFECREALERKPASAAALERYLGSGLIRGVGPATARKIVKHFGAETLTVFDGPIERLVEVRGIAERKLAAITSSWAEHRSVRDVMLFLQEHGVSTLFAVRIFKRYGDAAIAQVRADPYALARDIYGIGFFSADRIAASLGFAPDGPPRLDAAIRHVLAASRERGHCYLLRQQVVDECVALLEPAEPATVRETLAARLDGLVTAREVATRCLPAEPTAASPGSTDVAAAAGERASVVAYYAPSIFRAESTVARSIAARLGERDDVDPVRVARWLDAHAARAGLALSDEQRAAVAGIARQRFSILTGGPGCGKTTTLRTLVRLLAAMGRIVTLAAPTGRAAQRMAEVVGLEARTAHRWLEWDPVRGAFRRNADNPLPTQFLVMDETSMLDVVVAAALLDAVPAAAQVLLIGDPHQLPAVGPGAVLADLLASNRVPRHCLTQVFRQAAASCIVRHAHEIDRGSVPDPPSPLADPSVWDRGIDCLFLDAEQATAAELAFIRRAKLVLVRTLASAKPTRLESDGRVLGTLVVDAAASATSPGPLPRTDPAGGGRISVRVRSGEADATDTQDTNEVFSIPKRFLHVDLEALSRSDHELEEIKLVLRRIHPSSTLHHGLSLSAAVERLYTKTIPERLGNAAEIQILAPMNRGSVGADALNETIQRAVNPERDVAAQLRLGQRTLRVGDRVIQRRNDYDLGVFNGDIGRIVAIDAIALRAEVSYPGGPDGAPRMVAYERDALAELGLAYAITIHKAQGSEFEAVILPLVSQHHTMLFRDLVYTGLTRARRLAIFVGSRGALARAVANIDPRKRQTALTVVLDDLAAS